MSKITYKPIKELKQNNITLRGQIVYHPNDMNLLVEDRRILFKVAPIEITELNLDELKYFKGIDFHYVLKQKVSKR